MVWQGRRDPLEASIWDSWRDQEEEWDTEKFTEDELVDILFEVSAPSYKDATQAYPLHSSHTHSSPAWK